MKDNNLVGDTRQYLFKVGSIGRYIHNFSALPIRTLEQKVFEVHREIDMAYYLEHKEYKRYLVNYLEILAGKFLYLPNRELREQLKTFGKQKILGRSQKRLEKKSTLAVEEWVSSLNLEKDQQIFVPFLEATTAPRDC
jgi:hypothetical protein